MIGRLGKQAAEVALQFMADGMKLDDAVRAGAKLMDEELSPAAEMMLKQNNTARKNLLSFEDEYGGSVRQPEELNELLNSFYNPSILKESAGRAHNYVRTNPYLRHERPSEMDALAESGEVIAAANGYAIRQLLLDAAEGDMNVAAALAQRLGFGGLL